ncbi:MAG: competence/damage-inducible protein A [Actinobacteria bacterium]|nr:competence/damage-inducible protein A [Actinomycetota bacterium]MCL6104238.1 competence/damage-inducible protein A [Actinomycetota bacterium]
MRVEILAVGTELLLGQITDTNSSWIAERLAEVGMDSFFQTKVGDNVSRIALALRTALSRSDAVIVCGGLGPTHDDVTREAIAEVMNVPLVRDDELLKRIETVFTSMGRSMPANNAKQADVPLGAVPIEIVGTAPGLICPLGNKVVYATPGVPSEMRQMIASAVIEDLKRRSDDLAVTLSRNLRIWGISESLLAEILSAKVRSLDSPDTLSQTSSSGFSPKPTIAFLANAAEGIKIRITAKAHDKKAAIAVLDTEESEIRALLGDNVFGVDDQSMEAVVGTLLEEANLTLGLAESITGGLVAARLVSIPGASRWFKGSIVTYATEIKRLFLGVDEGPVVSEKACLQMAQGIRKALQADIGLAVTGVAGPEEQDRQPVGTVFLGLAMEGEAKTNSGKNAGDGSAEPPVQEVVHLKLSGNRESIRNIAAISLLDLLRRRLGTV